MALNVIIGAGVASVFGSSIISQTVGATMNKTYNIISYLAYGSFSPEVITTVQQRIERLDIAVKLKLTDNFINLPPDKKSLVQKTLETDINNLLQKIDNLLKIINTKLEEHPLKWFSSYRSLDVEHELTDLEVKSKLLDGRLKLIIEAAKYC
jgi:hypothetical protein